MDERTRETIEHLKNMIIVGEATGLLGEKQIQHFEMAIGALETKEIMKMEIENIAKEKEHWKVEAIKATAQLGEIRIMINKGGNKDAAN